MHERASRLEDRSGRVLLTGDDVRGGGLHGSAFGNAGSSAAGSHSQLIGTATSALSRSGGGLRRQSELLHRTTQDTTDTDQLHRDNIRRLGDTSISTPRVRRSQTTRVSSSSRTDGGLRRQTAISALPRVSPSRATGRHQRPDLTSSSRYGATRFDVQTPANYNRTPRPSRANQPHHATVSVYRNGSRMGDPTHWVSGSQTPHERALQDGYGRTLATHTEQRAIRHYQNDVGPGDRVVVQGHYSPCPSCQVGMRHMHAQTGADVEYRYRDETTGMERTWHPEFNSQRQYDTYHRGQRSGY